ncbi:MAG: hypothetical protein AAF824_04955 [Bacteroidota bacterium]
MARILSHSVAFIVYLLFQVLFFNHITLFEIATPHVFLLFVLFLPLDMPRILEFAVAFLAGLTLDLLSEGSAVGLYAFTLLFVVGFRYRVFRITSSGGYRGIGEATFKNQSFLGMAMYILPLIFVHHVVYYFLETFSFTHFFYTLFKILLSTVYTFLISFAIAVIFYKN